MTPTASNRKLPIAVDAMGGDRGPAVVVEGAVEAARKFGVASILVGDEKILNQELTKYQNGTPLPITIKHASQVIEMNDSPALAIRGKPDASVRVAFDAVHAGEASAVVSSGNTGAIMAAGLFVCGTLPGVARPAIASLIPRGATDSKPTVLLDSGANAGCQSHQLVQFALMGQYYAKSLLSIPNPRIALLSNGTELSKGNDLIRSAALVLSELQGLNFIGYVEGRDVARDVADVVVCDGFVGNIVLKAMEGTVELVLDSMRHSVEGNLRGKLGLWLAKPSLKSLFKDRLDPSAYGGAPLLGLGQLAIKCHGSSSTRAIMNGIRVARKFLDEDLLGSMQNALSALDIKEAGLEDDGVWGRVGQRFENPRGEKRTKETDAPGQPEGGGERGE